VSADQDKSQPLVTHARFAVGQLVHHRRFGYRGVVLGIDPTFQHSEQWYQMMAKSHPPKDKPWYHVAVHKQTHQTYVAERNLEADDTGLPVEHPIVPHVFEGFEGGRYVAPKMWN